MIHLLAGKPQEHSCGYAPRVIRRSLSNSQDSALKDLLFVGAKDGSVTALFRRQQSQDHAQADAFESKRLSFASPGSSRSGVRVIQEWGTEWLLLGRNDATLQLVNLRQAIEGPKATRPHFLHLPDRFKWKGPSGEESIRYATWLDAAQRRLLLSFRQAGTLLVTIEGTSFDLEALQRGLRSAERLDTEDHQLGGIRLAARIGPPEASPESFLLFDKAGRLWRWFPAEGLSSIFDGKWVPGEQPPALLNDVAYIGTTDGRFKIVRGLILATDMGIFALDLRPMSWKDGREPRPVRLTLPGTGVFFMSVTYVELHDKAHLWLTNRAGDRYLFENVPLAEGPGGEGGDFRDWVLGFRSAGLTLTNSQVMMALSWGEEAAIWLAEACRDDRIRITVYREATRVADRESGFPMLLSEPPQNPRRALEALEDFLRKKGSVETGWPPYAILTEVLDVLAEEDIHQFLEVLSSPEPMVAWATQMLVESVDIRHGEPARSLAAAIELWNLCLIGLVNRQNRPREEWYLGIFRFLRGLAAAPVPSQKDLLRAIDLAIRFSRKWGLYGEVNQIRQNLTVPLKILKVRRTDPNNSIDEMTYSSLLFRRRYSVMVEDGSYHRQGNNRAWAMSTLKTAAGTLIAVSWDRSGIKLGIVEGDAADEEQWLSFHYLDGCDRISPTGAEESGDDPYRYSRAVLLLGPVDEPNRENRFLLLTATRPGVEADLGTELSLWRCRLDREKDRWALRAEQPGPIKIADQELKALRGESVYELLKLDSDLIAVGLRGVSGQARVAIVRVSFAGELRLVDDHKLVQEDRDGFESGSSSHNRIWSLANVADGDKGSLSFLAGCENGEIWRVTIQRVSGVVKRLARVGRLAAPVTALACRPLPKNGLRVFAGTRDGTILCLQQNSRREPFSTLWATVEQGPISYIDSREYRRDGETSKLVLALARNGACVAVDDGDRMEVNKSAAEGDSDRPRRPHFPGIRRFRTRTELACFAAAPIEPTRETEGKTGSFLATASGNGEIRVITFCSPRFTAERKHAFGEQLEQLWGIVNSQEGGMPEHLRVVDAVWRAAPLLTLVPVRWLLDPDLEAKSPERIGKLESLGGWWYPRILRPLLDLREAWKDKPDDDKIKRRLHLLLDSSWRKGDIDLFQELCIVALKRINYQIFRVTSEDPETLRKIYFAVFEAIETSLQKWIGAPGRQETRARITVAKNLVDGDTFLRVVEKVVEHGDESPWFAILKRRIEGVRQLVFKDDFLVRLESLRAANHSLLRFCRKLSDRRRLDASKLTAVPWQYFESYFRQLVYGATQGLGPNPSLSDALFHEYARTFALCLCACPEGVVPMVNRLVEARLIVDPLSRDDLSARLRGQLTVLESAFEVCSFTGMDKLIESVLLPPEEPRELTPLAAFGEGEAGWAGPVLQKIRADLKKLDGVYKILSDLLELSDELSVEPGQFRLITKKGLENKIAEIESCSKADQEGLYRHSLSFWKAALSDLRKPLLVEWPGSKIRPEIVLFSRHLARWAKTWEIELQDRYTAYKIFQPQFRLFREVLLRLNRSADSFALGAAVQKNLVVGLLGHHLLEDMDLHVLEFREIARNLDPIGLDRVIPPQDKEDRSVRKEAAFASLLGRRAERALSLPKNLRSLAKVLNIANIESPRGKLSDLIQSLFSMEKRGAWRSTIGPDEGPEIGSKERELLALVLWELQQNYLDHSGLALSNMEKKEEGKASPRARWARGAFVFDFPFEVGKDEGRWKRLHDVWGRKLQQPFSPNPDVKVASTGAGLYLSCLAAAMIGWKLSMQKPVRDPADPTKGICSFRLVAPKKAASKPQVVAVLGGQREDSKLLLPPGKAEHIIVIDDKPAVALYVWREVGKVTGLGSAEWNEDAKRFFWPDDQSPKSIDTPNGELAVWWVEADGDWNSHLKRVLEEIRPAEAPCQFLIDVRGPVDDGERRKYDVEEIVNFVRQERPDDVRANRLWLISSYEHGTWGKLPIQVRPKTPDTFRQLLAEDKKDVGEKQEDELHILVTGAGFEFQGKPRELRLGMPPTAELLEAWISDCYDGDIHKEGWNYPVPRKWKDVLGKAAKDINLDEYWDELLAAERKDCKDCKGDALDIAEREHHLRDSFRRQFLCHDWGHLNQAIAAAGLEWDAWVSTNYTRFADRAIVREEKNSTARRWRTIETQEEAQRLEGEILHRSEKVFNQRHRLLFKVHGDISHVLTMAIAGEDKTFLSRLQSFAPLYQAAQSYLQQRSRDAKKVVWHIVGHGLEDQLLNSVILALFKEGLTRPQEHRFVVVSPPERDKEKKHPSEKLAEKLTTAPKGSIQGSFQTAERYLTRLARVGLARYEEVVKPLPRDEEGIV